MVTIIATPPPNDKIERITITDVSPTGKRTVVTRGARTGGSKSINLRKIKQKERQQTKEKARLEKIRKIELETKRKIQEEAKRKEEARRLSIQKIQEEQSRRSALKEVERIRNLKNDLLGRGAKEKIIQSKDEGEKLNW